MRSRRVALCVVALALAACGGADNVDRDISDDDADLRITPWTLYVNYDDHPNVAARCDGSTRLYTTTRIGGDGLIVVPTSPECAGGER